MIKLLIRFKPFALALSYALVILAGVTFGAPKYAKLVNLKNRHAALVAENNAYSQQIHLLKRNQERLLTDPDFFIKVFRENLGYVGYNELQFNIHEPNPR